MKPIQARISFRTLKAPDRLRPGVHAFYLLKGEGFPMDQERTARAGLAALPAGIREAIEALDLRAFQTAG
jgi:hypothetical protein